MRYRRLFAIGAVLLVALVVTAMVLEPKSIATAATGAPISFEDRLYRPLAPTRVLDTRSGLGAVGPVPAGGVIDVQVVGVAGVPATGVSAIVVNLTATMPSTSTYITAFPSGSPRPTASILNVTAGRTAPNLAILRPGTNGKVSLFNNSGSVHLIADMLGWIAESPGFTALAPARVLDTRMGLGAPGPVGSGATTRLQLTGVAGLPSSGVSAVVLNLTGTKPTTSTYVTAYPSDEARPNASNLNLIAGETRPNLVIAKVGADGAIQLYNRSGSVQLIADVLGWFAIGTDYAGITPTRVLDTRTGLGAPGPVGQQMSIHLQLAGVGGVPADAVGAVVVNLTGTQPTTSTYITAYPSDQSVPTASNLNLAAGQTKPNLVIIKLGPDGGIRLYNRSGSVQLIADVVGWISTGLVGSVVPSDDTAVIAPEQVSQVDPVSGDVVLTGPAPAVGDYIFVPPGGSAGDGLLGQVTSTEPNGGGTTVHTGPARLEDAFPSGDVHGSVDTRALAPGAVTGLRGAVTKGIADHNGVIRAHAVTPDEDCVDLAAIQVELNIEARFVIDATWGAGTLEQLNLIFELEVNGSMTLTLGAYVSCDVEIGIPIVLPPIWGFVPTLQPVLQLEYSGGLTLTSEVAGGIRVGASYHDGSIEWIHDGYVSGTVPEPQVAGEMTGRVSFGPKASVKFLNIVGASLFGGLFVEDTISFTDNPWWEADAGLEVSASLEADLWFTNFSYTLATLVFGRIDLSQADGPWPGPTFVTETLPAGTVDQSYDATINVSGSPPLTITTTAGTLPAGLSLTGSHIGGTPSAIGVSGFTLQVIDGQGRIARRAYTINILVANPPPITTVSVAANGAPLTGESTDGAASADGRWVVFASSAPEFSSSGQPVPVLRDMQQGVSQVLPLDAQSIRAYVPTISADGSTIAYTEMTATGYHHLGLVDRASGSHSLLLNLSSQPLDVAVERPFLTPNGRRLLFAVARVGDVANIGNGNTYSQSVVFDRDLNQYLVASLNNDQQISQWYAHLWGFASDGRYAFFFSDSPNLPDQNSGGFGYRIFRRDLQTNTTIQVPSVGWYWNAHVSENGRYVAGIASDGIHIVDLQTQQTSTVAVPSGVLATFCQAGATLTYPSNDALRFIVSTCQDNPYATGVVWSIDAQTNQAVKIAGPSVAFLQPSGDLANVAFQAPDGVVPADTNGYHDVFLWVRP